MAKLAIATDVAHSVCVQCVFLRAERMSGPCRNGRTDRDAIWGTEPTDSYQETVYWMRHTAQPLAHL